jgi:hypothetical protein
MDWAADRLMSDNWRILSFMALCVLATSVVWLGFARVVHSDPEHRDRREQEKSGPKQMIMPGKKRPAVPGRKAVCLKSLGSEQGCALQNAALGIDDCRDARIGCPEHASTLLNGSEHRLVQVLTRTR